MSHRMDEIKPEHYVTEKQCQEMIDKAIGEHVSEFDAKVPNGLPTFSNNNSNKRKLS